MNSIDEIIELYSASRCRNLETLIRTIRAAGRPRDFELIAELELLRDRRRQ